MSRQSDTEPKRDKRYLVMETSALIALFNLVRHDDQSEPKDLEALLDDRSSKRGSLFDHIIIPDHVLYEFTGILPISFPAMAKRFNEHKADPKALDDDIEFYTRVSPRGGTFNREEDRQIKNQVRTLLRFVANRVKAGEAFEDVVVKTSVAERYCKQLKVDHAVLAGTGLKAQELDEYRPTFGDAVTILGDNFNTDDLRVHIGQLFMLGFMTETQYNKRMALDEKILSNKQRFMKIKDFAQLLGGKNTDDKAEPEASDRAKPNPWLKSQTEVDALIAKGKEDVAERIKDIDQTIAELESKKTAAVDDAKAAAAKGQKRPAEIAAKEPFDRDIRALKARKTRVENDGSYVTVEFLRKHCRELMLGYHRPKNGTADNSALQTQFKDPNPEQPFDLVGRGLAPSKLLMEHYIFGDIFPRDAIRDIARILHYDLSFLQSNTSPALLNQALYEQGFFERSLTVGELKQIRDELEKLEPYQDGHALNQLNQFVSRIEEGLKKTRDEFNAQCKNPQDKATISNPKSTIAHVGLPYEKVIAQELINGTLTPKEFLTILEKSKGLPVESGPYHASITQDVVVEPGVREDGLDTHIYIRTDGFQSREGSNQLPASIAPDSEPLTIQNKQHDYYHYTLKGLIDTCQKNRDRGPTAAPVHRVLEACLFRVVSNPNLQATTLRDIAHNVLGEDRLVQMEKDFSNRRQRRWKEVMPPYADSFVSMHVNRRIERKSIGEIATAEAAVTVCAQHPQAHVWLVNHDSDLYPDKENGHEVIRFSDSVKRMRSEQFVPPDAPNHQLQDLMLQATADRGQLAFVGTGQFLKTIFTLNGRKPSDDEINRVLRERKVISSHHSGSWATNIADEARRIHSEPSL